MRNSLPKMRIVLEYKEKCGKGEGMTDYITLCDSLRSLISGVPHIQANLANASALLYNELPDLNWAGFYLFDG